MKRDEKTEMNCYALGMKRVREREKERKRGENWCQLD